MAHVRKQLRDQVVITLTGLTTTGSNVFSGRFRSLEQTDLPALVIYTNNEQLVDQITIGHPRQQQRQLDLVIEAHASGSNCDDTLDLVSKEVEVALSADVTINGLVKDCVLAGTELDFDAQDKANGVAKLTYQVLYIVTENNPEVSL